MASFNKVILVGNLTRNVELRYTGNNIAVADLGLAVNDRVKKDEKWQDETTFVDVTLWGKTAETAEKYLVKGSPALIEGRLKLDTWEKDGQKRSKLKIIGERLQLLGAGHKNEAPEPAAAAIGQTQEAGWDDNGGEEIPF